MTRTFSESESIRVNKQARGEVFIDPDRALIDPDSALIDPDRALTDPDRASTDH